VSNVLGAEDGWVVGGSMGNTSFGTGVEGDESVVLV